jgi:hypothetical protein
MLWGRLGYDPTLERAFFVKVLAARFPQVSGEVLYNGWAKASQIIPLVNRFHWRDWDFMWAVEGCMDQQHGFHTVDDFINVRPMEGSGLVSVPDYVEGLRTGVGPPGRAPFEVAAELQGHAEDALALLGELRDQAPQPDRELRATLGDIEAMAHLGNYYGAKIRGAVELCAFRQSKGPARQKAAIERLEEAVEHWQRYAAVAASQYRPQLLARTRQLDWVRTLAEVKRDVEIARAP